MNVLRSIQMFMYMYTRSTSKSAICSWPISIQSGLNQPRILNILNQVESTNKLSTHSHSIPRICKYPAHDLNHKIPTSKHFNNGQPGRSMRIWDVGDDPYNLGCGRRNILIDPFPQTCPHVECV